MQQLQIKCTGKTIKEIVEIKENEENDIVSNTIRVVTQAHLLGDLSDSSLSPTPYTNGE